MAGVPVEVLVVMLIVLPGGVIGLFAAFTFRHTPPLVYRCPRCRGAFRQPAHRRFPAACPLCHATDWNA